MALWIRQGTVLVSALLLAGCGGGGGVPSESAAEAADVVISGPTQALRGARVEWTVHMPLQPADDPPNGYAITLPEESSRIEIQTTPCPPPATTGCERWSLFIGRDARPGQHKFFVCPVGLRSSIADAKAVSLVVLGPASPHGRTEQVADDGNSTIVTASGACSVRAAMTPGSWPRAT